MIGSGTRILVVIVVAVMRVIAIMGKMLATFDANEYDHGNALIF